MAPVVLILALGFVAVSVFYLSHALLVTVGHYFDLVEKEAEDTI